MSFLSKILANSAKTTSQAQKILHKEQRGIYNVTYNGKNATYIKTDLDSIDNAIRYARGDRKQGAQHIKIRHTLESNQQGYLTQKELLNAGQYIREYLAKHKEPFIDERGARIYEWENKEGDRFRIVAMSDEKQEGARLTAPLSQPLVSDIITFYSDRNYKDKMIFKNPALNQSKNAGKESTKEANKATIKGDNFTTAPSNATSKTDYTTNITLESWVRQVAGIHPSKQVKADLEALYKKHPEMFAKPSEVYKLINEVKTNPQFFYTNNQPNIALIGKMLENGKLGKIGIQKDHTGNTIRVQHATKATKAQKDNERLLKRSDDYPLVERTTSTHPHSVQTHEGNRPNGANALSKDNRSDFTKNAIQKQDSSLDFLNDKAPLPMERE